MYKQEHYQKKLE